MTDKATLDRYLQAIRDLKAAGQKSATLARRASAEADALRSRVKVLEAEVAQAKAAHGEASTEVRELSTQLAEARATIERLLHVEPADPVDPIDPVDPGGTGPGDPVADGTPWTHAYRGCTADEAKAAIPPGWDHARQDMAARTPKRGRFELEQGADVVLEDILYTGPSKGYEKHALSLYHANPNGTAGNLSLRNVGLALEPGGDFENFLWFLRGYNIASFSMVACDIVGSFRDGRQRPVEHGAYVNVIENTYWGYNLFQATGGKGIYDCYRDMDFMGYPPDNLPATFSPTRIAEGNRLIDLDMDARKGSFADTVFDGSNSTYPARVTRRNNVIASAWDFERSQGNNNRFPVEDTSVWNPVRSCGAFCLNAYLHQSDYSVDLYERHDELIHLTQGNHPIGVIRNARKVHLSGLCVETVDHRNPYIDINSAPGANQGAQKYSETVTLENGVSSRGAQYRIWAEDGTYQLFPIDNPGRRVVYDGRTRTATESAMD